MCWLLATAEGNQAERFGVELGLLYGRAAPEGSPAEEVNIRSADAAHYQVVEEVSGALLETVDSSVVFSQLHPGAVYLHQGEAYLITRLDIQGRTAWVQQHAEPYYTVARDHTDLSIMKLSSHATVNGTEV